MVEWPPLPVKLRPNLEPAIEPCAPQAPCQQARAFSNAGAPTDCASPGPDSRSRGFRAAARLAVRWMYAGARKGQRRKKKRPRKTAA